MEGTQQNLTKLLVAVWANVDAIIGVGEKLGEFYWGPLLGSGIESWLAYVIALVFLLFRPQGLFGEKIIDRV